MILGNIQMINYFLKYIAQKLKVHCSNANVNNFSINILNKYDCHVFSADIIAYL